MEHQRLPQSTTPKHLTFFPLFAKKLQDTKDAKDQRRPNVSGKNKRKKSRKVEDSVAEPDTDAVVRTIDEENFKVLDLRTVHTMFDTLKSGIDSVKINNMSELQKIKHRCADELDEAKKAFGKEMEKELQKVMEFHTEKLDKLGQEVQHQKAKISLMSNIIQQNHQVIADLTRRLEGVELSNVKRSAILSGIVFSDKKKDRAVELKTFFSDVLRAKVDIEDSFLLGGKNPKSVVVTFGSAKDKHRAFAEKKLLKDYDGGCDMPVFLNDYLPPATGEKRRRDKDVVRIAKQDPNIKGEPEHTDKGIRVGQIQYKKQVQAPKPEDLLELTSDELDTVLKYDNVRGDAVRKEDSVFLPYSADVKSLQDVRNGYLKIRLMHARARHVVCAYNLPGNPSFHYQDFEDDEEHGAGRVLLNILMQNNIQNKAIYIVRFCGKTKLGSERFNCYVQALENVQKINDYNSILKVKQPITVTNPKGGSKTTSKKYHSTSSGRSEQERSRRGTSSRNKNDRYRNYADAAKDHSAKQRAEERDDELD